MPQFYQEICNNGHQITVSKSSPTDSQEFCSKCGEKTISRCTECDAPIEGFYKPDGVIYLGKHTADIPNYCIKCSKPYPWTKILLENAVELIALDTELSEDEKAAIKSSIPDLIVDTPKTPVAEAKFKMNFLKANKIVKDSLYNLLVDVVSETVKKSIFPN